MIQSSLIRQRVMIVLRLCDDCVMSGRSLRDWAISPNCASLVESFARVKVTLRIAARMGVEIENSRIEHYF